MHARHSRRGFLKGLVAGGLALPLSGLLSRAAAQSATPPRRLLCVYIPDGCSPAHWHPSGPETAFTLPAMTEPLAGVRQDLVFLQGLNMYAGGATHEGGAAKVLTATGEVSIDVFVGQYYRSQVPVSSVHLGVASTHENGGNYVSYLGAGQPITPDDNPLRAFERLFGAPGGVGDLGARRQLSILDCAQADLARINTRLGQAERQKLQLHADSLREVENRILAAAEGQPGSCENPDWNREAWSVPAGYNSYPPYWNRDDQFPDVLKLQMDLAVLALQCDLSRAVTLQCSHAVSPTSLAGATGVATRHHDASHFDSQSASSIATFTQLKRWYTAQVAYLVGRLAAVPEGEGTLLDHTLVFLCSELGHSARHDHRDMPFVLAGRAGGLVTGRYLDYRAANGGEGESHAKLLVSIANAMGIPVTSFGYTGHGAGPLPRLYT